uniref:O-methyltransferase domain-containing protein n=1 Tax=Alexandrium monilatum TaxID=311494 RepID=A0A7S4VLU3_9DINO
MAFAARAFSRAANLTPVAAAAALRRLPSAPLRGAWPAAALAASPPVTARAFSQSTWEAGDDVDIDSVAYGFMASQALFAGLELGVFDHIAAAGEAGLGAAAIGKACGVEAPRMQTLLTALTAVKCLKRGSDGLYTLSPNTAQYMVTSSRHFYGDYLRLQIGRQFYHRMGALPDVMTSGKAPSYASWFSDPEVAKTYTDAQHNGSVATAKYLVKKKLQLGNISSMLDVGGGSGAFSYVFVGATPGLRSTVLELPEVCRTGEGIKAKQPEDVRERVNFVELDASSPQWPVNETAYDVVLMSYISGSVPESIIGSLYANAMKALKPGGRLLVHDFMVNDSLDGPALGALWGLQHVTVNADGLGLCPKEIIDRMAAAGFNASKCETLEMIHGMTKLIVGHKD